MKTFGNGVAVITGAASGFGREFALEAARRGMRLVLADIQPDPLRQFVDALHADGVEVQGICTDVSQSEQVQALADQAFDHYGKVNLLFNNAGVAAGGLIWESTRQDWEWVLGVNVWGVINGIRSFVPRMIAQSEPAHVVNTASVAGLLSPPAMGVYNVSKHAIVAMSETLFQDLRFAGHTHLGVSVLCPAFVPTGINDSERHRPESLSNQQAPTASMRALQRTLDKAVRAGKLGAAEVATMTFAAIEEARFYIITHANIMDSVHLRHEDIAQRRNPTDPFSLKPTAAPDV